MTNSKRTGPALTAYRSTPSLLNSLRRAGWGKLRGRRYQGARAALEGLVALLPYGSGEGYATAADVGETGGRSERRARDGIRVLVEIGALEYRPGGVYKGNPQPSWFRIVKRWIVDVIKGGRITHRERQADRRAATRARIKRDRLWTTAPPARPDRASPGYNRRSLHPDATSDPRPPGEVPAPTATAGTDRKTNDNPVPIVDVVAEIYGTSMIDGPSGRALTTSEANGNDAPSPGWRMVKERLYATRSRGLSPAECRVLRIDLGLES